MNKARIGLLAVLAVVVGLYITLDLGQYLTLAYAQSQLDTLREYSRDNFALSAGLFFAAYVSVAALSIPGAAIMTLLGGAIFGLGWGLAGYCPGPALVAMSSGSPQALGFVAAMLVGMALVDTVQRLRA